MRIFYTLLMLSLLFPSLFLSTGAMGQSKPPLSPEHLRELPYNQRAMARAFGNVGGWWSFLSQGEKEAFLDGYIVAMRRDQEHSQSMCTASVTMATKDVTTPMPALVAATGACQLAQEFANYDKVTIQDLDEFYGDRINQPILLQWGIEYLRDRAAGSKTPQELADELKREQADIHDCGKYPNLCKLGIEVAK